jgi:heat shock protein HtpX
MLVTLALAAGYVVVAYLASGRAALALNKAVPADRREHAQLFNVVEEMALAAGIPLPSVYVVDDPAPNAFASGRDPAHASVTVTTGLLEVMSRRELQGVVAHEIAHIRNRDISVTTVAVLTVGAITVVCDLLLRIAWWGGVLGGRRRGRDDGNAAAVFLVVALALYLLAVPAALLLRAGLSRRREALADASAVELTRYPTGLRSALEKLEADTTVVDMPTHATAHLWIESPLERDRGGGLTGSFGRLFDTHPPLAERIALLRGYEGLDPGGRGPNDPAPARIPPPPPAGTVLGPPRAAEREPGPAGPDDEPAPWPAPGRGVPGGFPGRFPGRIPGRFPGIGGFGGGFGGPFRGGRRGR